MKIRVESGAMTLPAPFVTITKFWRNYENRIIPDVHFGKTLIPSLNHLPRAEFESKRLVVVARTVELHTVGKQAGVMNNDRFTSLRLAPSSLFSDQIS